MKHLPVIAVNIFMPIALYLAILSSPAEARLGESARFLYFHVPVAACAVISFLVSAAAALLYLKREKPEYEALFHFAAVIGLGCTILTAISGAIWAKIAWGSFWNWDPRETSIVFLMIIYLSYFVFSASLAGKKRTAGLRAVYLLFSAIPMPFFVFIMPRILPSLHPNTIINAQKTVQLSSEMRIALFISILAFVSLLTVILSFKYRISKTGGRRT